MRTAFRYARNLYLVLVGLYIIAFWILMPLDDLALVRAHGRQYWLSDIGLWYVWHLIFLIAGSLYYWLPVSLLIVFYKKVIDKDEPAI